MVSFLRRYVITIADLKSGIERRATVSVWSVLAVIAATMMLPLLIAFGAAWKANRDVEGLYARHRALEIEAANYRAAIDALIGQIGSQQSTVPDEGAKSARSSDSAPDPAAGTPVVRSPAPLAPPMPAPVVEPGAPAALAPVPPATVGGERGAGTEAAGRGAFMQALARLGQTRASAEAADAPALASPSYRAGVTLELEAQELATAGRMNDALVRAIEADARFRAAEIEARAQAAAWERLGAGDAPTTPVRPSLAEAPEEPADSPRGESRQPLRAPVPTVADVEGTVRDVIAQYVNGLESRNLAALKRVWPSLGGSQERAIQTEFENARTVYAVFTDPRITINGDTTTVTGFRMYGLVTQDGQRLSSVTRTTMTLRRNGDAWVIERVVHQQ